MGELSGGEYSAGGGWDFQGGTLAPAYPVSSRVSSWKFIIFFWGGGGKKTGISGNRSIFFSSGAQNTFNNKYCSCHLNKNPLTSLHFWIFARDTSHNPIFNYPFHLGSRPCRNSSFVVVMLCL